MKKTGLFQWFTIICMAVLLLAACQSAVLQQTDRPIGIETADQETAAPSVTAAEDQVAVTSEPSATTASGETSQVVKTLPPTEDGSMIPETGAQVPDGWQIFSDPTFGYSVAFPKEWEKCTETRYSHLFCEIQKEPAGMGPPPRLYISVIPQDYTNEDFEVYNFMPFETIREFLSIPVGESRLKEPGAIPPEYFTYTRLPDQTVAGWKAAVIENSRVWEAPSGTRDRVYLIDTDDAIYMIGQYYMTPEQLDTMEKVLDSFRLKPK
jgi:hypothetical protein